MFESIVPDASVICAFVHDISEEQKDRKGCSKYQAVKKRKLDLHF